MGFPLPMGIIVSSFIGIFVCWSIIVTQYKAETRRDPLFLRAMATSCLAMGLQVSLAYFLVLVYVAFAQASGALQTVLSLVVPILKWAVKRTIRFITNKSHNPNFIHGASYWTECQIGCFSALVFTEIKDPITFMLMLLVDVAENVYIVMKISSVAMQQLDREISRLRNATFELRKLVDKNHSWSSNNSTVS